MFALIISPPVIKSNIFCFLDSVNPEFQRIVETDKTYGKFRIEVNRYDFSRDNKQENLNASAFIAREGYKINRRLTSDARRRKAEEEGGSLGRVGK